MKLSVFLRRADQLTSDEFRAWWVEHTATSRHIPGLRGYRICFVEETRAFGRAPDACRYDGVAQLWFDAAEELSSGFESDTARAAVQDADAHCSQRIEFETTEHVVLDGPDEPEGLVKVCVQLRRRPDLTREAFHAWWLDHVALAARMPGLRGYRVNLVHSVRGAGFGDADVDIDGTAELWWDDLAAADAGFGSPEGATAAAHAAAQCSVRVRHITRERVVVG